ncbi:MAG: efflux transporter periplasmic adaptor subunit, partial [Deltaproteobacteria bacterium]|nr:efflux transporter periplasmic adaptor subunit [Deltaproteobacteria bacterium]
KAIPGERPPLISGMFCRVELHGPARTGSIVLPRSAIQNSDVFIIDHETRLRKKHVVVDFTQAEFAVIKSGLSGGEMVVVSDASPAIIGMKILPEIDDGLQERITALSQVERAKQ